MVDTNWVDQLGTKHPTCSCGLVNALANVVVVDVQHNATLSIVTGEVQGEVLEGECPYVSSPTINIQLECRSNRSPKGILGDLEVCSAIKPFFYYFS